MLFFLRDNCQTSQGFMLNILNHVGHGFGLEQIEMFLLAKTLNVNIHVHRFAKHGTEEFEGEFGSPDALTVNICTVDDRHYNSLSIE